MATRQRSEKSPRVKKSSNSPATARSKKEPRDAEPVRELVTVARRFGHGSPELCPFEVRAGIPILDALERVDSLLGAASDAAGNLAETFVAEASSGADYPIESAQFSIAAARALVIASRAGLRAAAQKGVRS